MGLRAGTRLTILRCSLYFRQDEEVTEKDCHAAATGADGSVILADHWAIIASSRDFEGDDFNVVKLDAEGNEIWRWQVRCGVHAACHWTKSSLRCPYSAGQPF